VSAEATGPRVLYVAYWGALEPLGQSLVVPSILRLADLGGRLTLITYEKRSDQTDAAAVAQLEAQLDARGIRWRRLLYHRRPKWPATVFDVVHGILAGLYEGHRLRAQIVHARTFVGGVIGRPLARLLGAQLIYHNEGFYPDEQVDGGVWRKGSLAHRLGRALERRAYKRARGAIVLSDRARHQLQNAPAALHSDALTIVVPSCVDFDHFAAVPRTPRASSGVLRLVYVGSVGGRYRFDEVARFAAVALAHSGAVHLRVLSRTDPTIVARAAERAGLPRNAWSHDCVPRDAMPRELAAQDAGLFLFERGLSEHGCSPTKVGEYWASGVPVVTTPNVSDTEEIVREERVGVLVPEFSEDAYRKALDELVALLADPDLAARCRRAAARHYSLAEGCQRQMTLYRRLIEKES
jgi:glycosyltransferase involved in cell wall biosynthesis